MLATAVDNMLKRIDCQNLIETFENLIERLLLGIYGIWSLLQRDCKVQYES